MYEDEVKQKREDDLKKWKIGRLVELEDSKEVYLENYEKKKKEIEEAKHIPQVQNTISSLTYTGGCLGV
jgi:hypothetical protein